MVPKSNLPTQYRKMMAEFGVKNEEQLFQKLVIESLTLPCIECGKEFALEDVVFIDGNPYCREHKNKSVEYYY